jgi:rhomboid protease GluP
MFKRQTSGSCVCVFCNQLISVNNAVCPNCKRKNPSLWGYSRTLRKLGADLGFTSIVTWGCIFLYLATLATDFQIGENARSNFLAPSNASLLIFGATGSIPVFELGRWWTVLSAGWLHGGLLHILFNLLWIRSLSFQVAEAFGSGRLVIIYTVAIITGCLLSSSTGYFLEGLPLQGSKISIGASGGVFGLLGALVAYGQITGHFATKQQAWTLAVVMFIFGLVMPQVDNWGHFGGFLGGYLVSWVAGIDPRQPEGMRQLFVAIACLALTVISIAASLVHAFAFNFFDVFS